MTDTSSRKAHLLALAHDAEREAERLFGDREYARAERFRLLAPATPLAGVSR